MRSASRRKQRGWWNFIIPAVTSLVGGALTNKTNESNANQTTEFNSAEAAKQREFASNEAAIAREFNSAQASRQMDYQTEMSNTQWQRGVKDMQNAGLNPMLAFSQGPASALSGASASASAPSGATATGVTPEVKDFIGGAVSTAIQARRADQEIKNMKAQEDLVKAERDKVAQEALNAGTMSEQIVATTQQIKAATEKARVDTNVSYERIKEIIQHVEESRARTKNINVDTILKDASIAEAKAIEQFYKTTLGESHPFVKLLMQAVSIFKR